MRMTGLVDASGLIGSAEQTGSPRSVENGRTNKFVLWDGSEQGGSVISVTQEDVRAIQLAKSALYAGARLLMDKLETDTVDRVVLAGAFGAHISPKHALVLGMIPDCAVSAVTSAGNAAGTGARIALLNRAARRDIEKPSATSKRSRRRSNHGFRRISSRPITSRMPRIRFRNWPWK